MHHETAEKSTNFSELLLAVLGRVNALALPSKRKIKKRKENVKQVFKRNCQDIFSFIDGEQRIG